MCVDRRGLVGLDLFLGSRVMEQFVALRHRHGTISDMVGGRTKVSLIAAAAAVAAAASNAECFCEDDLVCVCVYLFFYFFYFFLFFSV